MSLKYLALGDSYTIGEQVAPADRWPHLLQQQLAENGIDISLPDIIATTGWTTEELQAAISKQNPQQTYDLVSLLIGVNNQYRDYDIAIYKTEFEALLLQSIQFARGKNNRVFVVSIPDYGVTPFAIEKNPPKIAEEIEQYNAIASDICHKHQIPFFDITADSKNASHDKTLIADDGLHPSAKMYKNWVEIIYNDVRNLLK
jgi:lysophospholipase L1-like esterase